MAVLIAVADGLEAREAVAEVDPLHEPLVGQRLEYAIHTREPYALAAPAEGLRHNLAARYGLHQIPITGIDPESEPSPQHLRNLIELVRREHVTTVFFERLVSPRLAETVARDAHAKTAVLDPIEGLTPSEQAHGDDYLTLMRRNLQELRTTLGCR